MQDPYCPDNDPDEPAVGYDAESLTRTSVILTGSFKDSPEITEYGFEMAANGFEGGAGQVIPNPPKDSKGRFSSYAALSPGQVYNIRTYFTNGTARKYSKTMTLKTPATSVATLSDVSFSDWLLRASVLDDGGTPVQEVGFCWSVSPDPEVIKRNKVKAVLNDDNSFSLDISFLEWGKVYYIMAYAENSAQTTGEAYGYSQQPFEMSVTDDLPVEIQDPAFKRVLLEQCDTNKDGIISYKEIKGVKSLSFSTDDISDIGEIRMMPELGSLRCNGSGAGKGRLTQLDLGGNPLLRELSVSGNLLELLDLSPCPYLETLDASSCQNLHTVYLAVEQWSRAEKDFRKDAQASFLLAPEAIVPVPDAHFRKYLVDTYDKDGDNRISGAEAAAVTRIEVCTDEIESLSGIEFFNRLTWLKCAGSKKGLLALGRLEALDVSYNPLTFLDCTANPGLSAIWLKTGQQIEAFDYDSDVSKLYYK